MPASEAYRRWSADSAPSSAASSAPPRETDFVSVSFNRKAVPFGCLKQAAGLFDRENALFAKKTSQHSASSPSRTRGKHFTNQEVDVFVASSCIFFREGHGRRERWRLYRHVYARCCSGYALPLAVIVRFPDPVRSRFYLLRWLRPLCSFFSESLQLLNEVSGSSFVGWFLRCLQFRLPAP